MRAVLLAILIAGAMVLAPLARQAPCAAGPIGCEIGLCGGHTESHHASASSDATATLCDVAPAAACCHAPVVPAEPDPSERSPGDSQDSPRDGPHDAPDDGREDHRCCCDGALASPAVPSEVAPGLVTWVTASVVDRPRSATTRALPTDDPPPDSETVRPLV